MNLSSVIVYLWLPIGRFVVGCGTVLTSHLLNESAHVSKSISDVRLSPRLYDYLRAEQDGRSDRLSARPS